MKKRREWFLRLKLNRKFTMIIAFIVFVPIFIFSMIYFKNMKEEAIKQVMEAEKIRMAQTNAGIQKTAELCRLSTQTFLSSLPLQDLLGRLRDGEDISTEEYLDFDRQDIAVLERLVNSNPYLYQIRVYAKSDDFPEMLPILYHQERMNEQPWADTYVSGKWQFDYPDALLSDTVMNAPASLMALVTDITNRKEEHVGTVEVAVRMEEAFPGIYGSDEATWEGLQKENGSWYTRGAGKWESMRETIANLPFNTSGTEASCIHTRLAGEDVIVLRQPVTEFSGTLIRLVSVSSQLAQINGQRNVLLAAMLLLFVFLVFFIDFIVRIMLNRFYRILEVIRKITGGDLTARAAEGAQDEFGELGTQINMMVDRLSLLITENVNRERLMKNSEIKALQNQINSHFIYNVLESIKMMAEIDEKYDISDAITSLGELLRYSMRWVSGNVTISEELAYIANYLQLINLRYDFTINLSMKIPPAIMCQQIPKMSLQPVVENAIYHGIEELAEDATIYIKATEEGNDYVIEITDSGKGMSEEQMELLMKKLRGEIEVSGGSGNGIGLKNVQDRIRISFGEQYGISIASRVECYTKIKIRLPQTNSLQNTMKTD